MKLMNGIERKRAVAERLRTTLELVALAEDMIRVKTRRENPGATAAEIEGAVGRWYAHRPGAKQGDGVGRPGTWPRRRA